MLTRYTMTLQPDRSVTARPEWGYRLYAALLDVTPAAFGNLAHQDGATPVSQYLRVQEGRLIWSVSLLGRDSEAALGPALDEAGAFILEKDRVRLTVTDRKKTVVPDVEDLLDRPFQTCSLCFHTATAFKSRGKYVVLPTPRLILQSLMKKWNGCISECPIEDEDEAGMEAMAEGLRFRNFQLHDRIYYLKGRSIPGFVGTLVLENRLEGFHRQLAGGLFAFAGFSGIGIKTALGMGGVEQRDGI